MTFALCADGIITPSGILRDHAVVVRGDRIAALQPADAISLSIPRVQCSPGVLTAGFIDLQVNGGGGVLFNDDQSVEGLATIAAAHRRYGVTGVLPTLISDSPETIARGIAAVDAAICTGVPGILGIHIEGPYLNSARKGIHDSRFFRQLDDEAIALISSLQHGRTLVTVAPECTTPDRIAALVARGVIVSAGHSASDFDTMRQAAAAGLTTVTHLFNAMSQIEPREPGLVGAALTDSRLHAGLIADGHHVHAANLELALRTKGPEGLFLVSDAMPSVGTELDRFMLGETRIIVHDGRCVDENGRLAGAHLHLAEAVQRMQALSGCTLAEACTMASATPARVLRLSGERGTVTPGLRADLVLLGPDGKVCDVWIAGVVAAGAKTSS